MSVFKWNFRFTFVAFASIGLLSLVTCERKVGPGEVNAKDWFIKVGPDPCELTENGKKADQQKVTKKGREFVVWQSDSGQSLELRFHIPTTCENPPFARMTGDGLDPQGLRIWVMSDENQNGTIFSGPVLKDGCYSDDNGFKYYEVLGGQECQKDGWIIVKG
jgi:hypothetical protein